MSSPRRPQSYIVQDGCYNCAHAFKLSEYEVDDKYFCAFSVLRRPYCGSMYMDECFGAAIEPKINEQGHVVPMNNNEWHKALGKAKLDWEQWAKGRDVEPWGKCSLFKCQSDTGEGALPHAGS